MYVHYFEMKTKNQYFKSDAYVVKQNDIIRF